MLKRKNKFPMNKAADITFSNPPYNNGIDLKIIMALHDAKLLKKLICVHPSTWLVDPKNTYSLFTKFKLTCGKYLKKAELFNGNPVFGIGLFVPCAVTLFNFTSPRKVTKPIQLKFLGGSGYSSVGSLEDVTLHGDAWVACVKDFHQHMVKVCKPHNVWGKSITSWGTSGNPNPSKYYVQLSTIRGHVNLSGTSLVQDDFYTMIMKNPQDNIGVRLEKCFGHPRTPTYSFSTREEQENFNNYLQTDFARLSLSLLKNAQRISSGEMDLIPWLDFTQSWDDEKLFTCFGYPVGHPVREYAKEFLPDYYNLYPNGKAY